MKMKITKHFLTMTLALVIAAVGFLPIAALPARAQDATKLIKQAIASAAQGSTTSDWIDIGDATSFTAYLTVTAKAGGSTSLDLKYQDSPDKSTAFDLTGASFSQVTGSTSSQAVVATRVPSRYVRAVATVVGTTFTFHTEFMATNLKGGQVITSATDGSLLTGLNASALGSGTVPTGRLSEDVARTVSVTVTTGQVLALHTTPIALVAAPGAGKVILVDEITAKLVFNSVAYTGSNALEFRYTDGSGAKVSADIASTFINSASGTNYASVKSVVTALTPVANAAVVVAVPVADPGAGNSAIVFSVKYRIVTP